MNEISVSSTAIDRLIQHRVLSCKRSWMSSLNNNSYNQVLYNAFFAYLLNTNTGWVAEIVTGNNHAL